MIFKAKVQNFFAHSWNEVQQVMDEMAQNTGVDGLSAAIKSGMLDVHQFKVTDDLENMVREFFEIVSQAVSSGSTFPLLDDKTGGLIKAGIEEGIMHVSDSAISRGKHIGLAADLLERLPLFDTATIEEVLDIRKELEKPLVRFRSAIIKFSDSIKTASWDPDFQSDAEQVLYREIQPAIAEIEESIQTNRFLNELTRKAIDKPLEIPSKAALGLLMSHLSSLPAIVTTSFGIGVGGTIVVYDAYKEWIQKQQAIERNQLYFYYRAGRLLSDARS